MGIDTHFGDLGTSTMGFYKHIMEFQTRCVNCDSKLQEVRISRMGSTMGILWLPHQTVIPKINLNCGNLGSMSLFLTDCSMQWPIHSKVV